jgi:pimeloyl-ACP methyl ester carboxylesterase
VSIAAVRAFLASRDDADPAVGSEMRSTVLEGSGDTAVVLLHGLTASPPAWASIAADLNARGATVVSVRLPLHGHADRLSTALEGLTADLLTVDLAAIVGAVASLDMPIVIGGHSLGGTLAIHAAATLPAVDRVVAIAPFLGIASLPHEMHGGLVSLIDKLPNLFLWWDPVERERQLPAHGYPRYPLHALGTGLRIADAVYADAERAPHARAIDLVINAQESSVNNRAVRRLADRWRATSAVVAVHRLDGLPPSHDIIEPARSNSRRARATLVELFMSDAPRRDTVHVI